MKKPINSLTWQEVITQIKTDGGQIKYWLRRAHVLIVTYPDGTGRTYLRQKPNSWWIGHRQGEAKVVPRPVIRPDRWDLVVSI